MNDARLTELETRLAHQEHTIAQLDAVVTRQQNQIDKLEAALQMLAQRYQAAADGGPTDNPQDEIPPHY